MVNFQIASDLHIEVYDYTPPALSLITPKADILILAGDIGHIHKYEQLRGFLVDVCQHFQYVLYIMGNHEYYHEEGMPRKNMDELFSDVKKIESEIKNLKILDRSSVLIDNVCVIGCTLWSEATNVPPFIVRVNGLNKNKYNSLYQQDKEYISRMIRYCDVNDYKLLVVTHHTPTYDLLNLRRKRERFKSLYASHLDHLLDNDRVHTWVCGHIHVNFDRKSNNGTRLVGNQKGKPKDRITDYEKGKVISV